MIDPSIIKNMFPQYCYNPNLPYRNYDLIDFERLVSDLYPDKNLFVKDYDLISKIRRTPEEIKEYGIKSKVKLNSIYYYQKEVGISGPFHTEINEPKSIIEVGGRMILLNGYHRTLIDISKGESTIEAYILTIEL